MKNSLSRLFEVRATDAEDARRRKLLNILLAGVGAISLLMVVLTAIVDMSGLVPLPDEVIPIYVIGIGLFLTTILMYSVNRYLSGQLASLMFLILLIIVIPFSDTPREVAAGRSLFAFTLPIVMASMLLRPYTTFVFAALGSLEISLLAVSIGEIPNVPAILSFFLIALICWLSARSLDNVLQELINVNQELDFRVMDRTQALSEALARERAEAGRSQAILEGIADGVMVLDNSDRVSVVNPAIETLIGHPASEILGASLSEWLNQSTMAQRERDTIRQFFLEPSIQNRKMKFQWSKKTLAVSIAPVRVPDGKIIGRVAVFHDFTREAEVDRLKNDFLAMVSHELRTPLNSILGYADMLREGVYGKLGDRQVSIVERVMANTHKLLAIVNDLLDQAQIEAGRITFHNRYFQPYELTDYMHGVMESIVHAKDLKLIVTISNELPRSLYGDPQRLNQVLVNLVSNAVKFTEHGSIQVRLYPPDSAHWAIEVADTGEGIPEDAQKLIFEPFRQVNMEITNRTGGIGLGLSIVKRLVNLMHGEICLNSQVGKGSVFTVILPLNGNDKGDNT